MHKKAAKKELKLSEIKDALRNLPDDDVNPSEDLGPPVKRFRTIDELRAETNLNVVSDPELLRDLIASYRAATDEDLRKEILDELEHLVHQVIFRCFCFAAFF